MGSHRHAMTERKVVQVVVISDTHQKHGEIAIPDGDILVHAGDVCARGTLEEVSNFMQWFDQQPHRHKVCIAGNHDFPFQVHHSRARQLVPPGVTYLQDRSAVVAGLVFYGMPWQPWFYDWAFNLPRDGEEMHQKVRAIPADTQVLVTHGPPADILDGTVDGQRVGCHLLRNRVQQLPGLLLHAFGHIHEGYGVVLGPPTFVNASICTRGYEPSNDPVVVDIEVP